jgi:LuxR family transcriptional regulator, maltose regulon positive regulatory protein
MPRKEHHSTPKVIEHFLYTDTTAVALDSPAWFAWLEQHSTFYFASPLGSFTARCEQRGHALFWYAFRRYRKQLYKAYLGRLPDLTSARLLMVAQLLAEKAGA